MPYSILTFFAIENTQRTTGFGLREDQVAKVLSLYTYII